MITKEEYEKTFIRMMDSVRTDNKGEFNCSGISWCTNCPIIKICRGGITAQKAFELIEFVEKWGKEHPIVTYADKFKEVFGREPRRGDGVYECPSFCVGKCPRSDIRCCDCSKEFWNSEYKEPEKKEEEQ